MTLFSPHVVAAGPNRPAPVPVPTSATFLAAPRFISATLRPTVLTYVSFAAAGRAIADDPNLDPDEKVRRLSVLDAALAGRAHPDGRDPTHDTAIYLRDEFAARGVPVEHVQHLLQAYHADAAGRPCRSWSELLAYCRYAAAPAGRFLLDLHGERRSAWPAVEALYSALLILDDLRNCQPRWRDLQRLHIPREWLSAANVGPDALLADRETRALRGVFEQLLDGVDGLLDAARVLPRLVADRGLRMELAATLATSRRLAGRLRRADPLARDIRLSTYDRSLSWLSGAWHGWMQ